MGYNITHTAVFLILLTLSALYINWRILVQSTVSSSFATQASYDEGTKKINTKALWASDETLNAESALYRTKRSTQFRNQNDHMKYLLQELDKKRNQLEQLLANRERDVRYLEERIDRGELLRPRNLLQLEGSNLAKSKSDATPTLWKNGDGTDNSKQRQCSSVTLVHGKRHEDISAIFNQTGILPWLLVDAFVTRKGNPCSYNTICEEKLPVATVVITAKVYQTVTFGLSHGQEKQRKAKEYSDLYSDKSARWTCEYEQYGRFDALRTLGDGDKHTLVVRCPLPSVVLEKGHDKEGRLVATLTLSVVNATQCYFRFQNIPVCDTDIVSDINTTSEVLAACTMVRTTTQELERIDSVAIVENWTRYMLASGFSFVAIYIDADDGSTSRLNMTLQNEVLAGSVKLIWFHLLDGYPFQTQSAQENHCQWRFRGAVSWLAHLDVDEYLQPLGSFKNIRDVLSHYDASATETRGRELGAVQVKNLFWDHHPDLEANWSVARTDVWNMQWRDAQGAVLHGRGKIICKPAKVDYVSVHRVTTGWRTIHCNPETELRHNHFSRHLKGYDVKYACGSKHSDKRCANAMRSPIHDDSFFQHYIRLMSNYSGVDIHHT